MPSWAPSPPEYTVTSKWVDTAELARLRQEDGLTIPAVAARLCISTRSARTFIVAAGLPARRPKHDPAQRARIAAAYAAGETQRAIAAREGVSQPAVSEHIRRYREANRAE